MPVKVFTAEHISEAGLIQSYLEQHDIDSQLRNEHVSSVIGELPFMMSSPEVWVSDSLAKQAADLITQLEQAPDAGPDWLCISCDEVNPSNFASCWQCQTVKP